MKAKKSRLIRNVTKEKLGGADDCQIQKVRNKLNLIRLKESGVKTKTTKNCY